MVMPYQTSKLKSVSIFAIEIWGPTANFDSHQYFQLYGMRKNDNMSSGK